MRRHRGLLLPLALCLLSLLALALLTWRVSAVGALSFPLADPATSTSQFYPPEVSSDGIHFRWSRPASGLLLPALGWRQVYTVEMLFPGAPQTDPGARVALSAAGKSEIFEPRPGWGSYSISARSQLGVSNSLDIAPAEGDYSFYPGSGDRRRLGAAVREVRLAAEPSLFGLVLPAPLLLAAALLWPWLGWGILRRLRAGASAAGGASAATCVFGLLVWLLPARSLPAALALAAAGLGLGALIALLWPGGRLPSFLLSTSLSGRAHAWLAVTLYTLAGVVATWPLALRLADAVPGWPADNFAFLYKIWWARTALQTGVSLFFDPNVFYPFGFFFGRGEPTMPNTMPAALLAIPFGDAAGYNLVLLASFTLSGLGAYLLARELTGSRAAALLAGLIFALAPYRMAQLAGHLQITATHWIPLTFFFVERAFKTRRALWGALAGLCYALAVLTAWYYAVIVAIALLIYLPLRFFAAWRARRAETAGDGGLRPFARSLLVPLLAFAVVSAVLTAPALWLALEAQSEAPLRHSAKAADENSASPHDYVIPNQLHPLWGAPFMRAHADQNIIEDSLYLGVAPLALATVALLRRRGPAAGAWLALGISGFVLSLGLTLHSPGGPVEIAGETIPLPAQLLYHFAPGFGGIRAYARFGVLVALAVSSLGALGYVALRDASARSTEPRASRSSAPLLFALLAFAVLVDFWTAPYPWGLSTVRPPAVAGWLAGQPGEFAVFQAPLESAIAGPPLFAGTFYHKKLAYGYETFEPPLFAAGRATLREFPDQRAIDLLKSWNVRYVVVDANAYGADWPGFEAFLDELPSLRRAYGVVQPPIYSASLWVADARPELSLYFAPSEQVVYELR